jgi:hypothetical protein
MDATIGNTILEYIDRNRGGVGFYHIVRRFGMPSATYDLPVMIQHLITDGLIKVRDSQAPEAYCLTENKKLGVKSQYCLFRNNRRIFDAAIMAWERG